MMLLCDICGDRSPNVRAGLVAWLDPAQPFAAVDRCEDRAACRARVEAAGDEWPVYDPEDGGQVTPRSWKRTEAGEPIIPEREAPHD